MVLRANENSILSPSIEISLMPFSLLVGWTFLTPIYPFAAFNELFSFASFSSQIECRVTRVRITEWFKVKVWRTQNSKCVKRGINVNWTWKWKPICFNHSCNNICWDSSFNKVASWSSIFKYVYQSPTHFLETCWLLNLH